MTQRNRTFADLGYSHLDTAEIVVHLNKLLSSYSVYHQKLKNYSLNMLGSDFFELRKVFVRMYQSAINETDEIAERIRLFGEKPASSFTEYLNLSGIKEDHSDRTSFEMVKHILNDIKYLISSMEETINAARNINDNGTEYLLQRCTYRMEKDHFLLTSWVKQKI